MMAVPKDRRRVAVVGGGAGGLAAAAAAARLGAEVIILEKSERVGKKLLRTGNGRCNLSNRFLSPEGYNHPEFVAPTLSRLPCAALCSRFAEWGLWTVSDDEGRVYPASGAAASVLDILRLACSGLGATEKCGFEAASVHAENGGFSVYSRGGEAVYADAVVAATGGGTVLLEGLGHPLVPFSPVLCPIRTETGTIRGLSGLRVRCRASLLDHGRVLASESGELLFRDYGVSGILAFDLSRYAAAGQVLSLDLAPEKESVGLLSDLQSRISPVRDPGELLTGIFRRRVAEALIRYAGGGEPEALCTAIKDFRLPVLGLTETDQAQVTRGGADVMQFNPITMESKLLAGLYAAGETLDIDGRCGGYNLHWAFSSGLVAGENAARGGLPHD